MGAVDATWALGGLEALYGINGRVGGRSARIAQLCTRLEILIGRPKDLRYLRGMYKYRSRMVHGGADTPFSFRGPPLVDKNEKYDRVLSATEAVAAAMLLASVQQLVVRGWSGGGWGVGVRGRLFRQVMASRLAMIMDPRGVETPTSRLSGQQHASVG